MSNVYIYIIHTRICIMLNYILYCIVSTEIYSKNDISPDPIDVTVQHTSDMIDPTGMILW